MLDRANMTDTLALARTWDDVAAGFAELHRVLKPGATAYVSSWVRFDESPGMQLMAGAIRVIAGESPVRAGWSRLHTEEQMQAEMAAAGFRDIEVRRLCHDRNIDDDIESFWARSVRGSAPLTAMRRAIGEEVWQRREAAAIEFLRREQARGAALDMPARLGIGTR